jgi:hypothetical protein
MTFVLGQNKKRLTNCQQYAVSKAPVQNLQNLHITEDLTINKQLVTLQENSPFMPVHSNQARRKWYESSYLQ